MPSHAHNSITRDDLNDTLAAIDQTNDPDAALALIQQLLRQANLPDPDPARIVNRESEIVNIPPPLSAPAGRGAGGEGLEHVDPHAQHMEKLRADRERERQRQEPLIPIKPRTGPFCKASTSRGLTCRAHPQEDSDLCIYHDPDFAEQRRQHAREGGIASGEARQPRPLLEPRVAALADPISIQVLLDAVLRLELLGKMTDARGKRLARLLSLAVRNVSRDGLDPAAYTARRQDLDDELSEVVSQYEQEDHERRINAIGDVGLKRHEYLEANALFAS